ncbi:MAG: hypothetical protein QXR26_03675 [Candidatus Caldarchaeum sp.]
MDVWIAGVGEIPCKHRYPGMDFREMLYEAAKKAYQDAGITPAEVDGIVSSGMDFFEGISITDSYTPDQVGGRLKFNTLVSNDGLNVFIHAYMLVRTGFFKNLMVTAYAKPSNIINYPEIILNSFDPHVVRPLCPHHYVIAALDANAYLRKNNADTTDLSLVSVKNKKNALKNPSAAYGGEVSLEDVEGSESVSTPLKKGHVAQLADYAAAVILTSDKKLGKVVVKGVGQAFGGYSSDLALRDWGTALWAKYAVAKAFKQAGTKKVDFVEVAEPFAHTELMFLESLELEKAPHKMLRDGSFNTDGQMPVNPSGGCIGMGYPLNAGGLQRLVQSVKLLTTGKWKTCLTASPDGEVVDAGSAVFLSGEV